MTDLGGRAAEGITGPVALLVNDGAAPFAEGVVKVGALEVEVVARDAGSGRRIDLTVRNPGRHPALLAHVAVRVPVWPERVLEQGHQGASVVRRCSPSDVRPARADAPEWVRGCHMSDPTAAGRVVGGDQFLLTTEGLAGFLDGRRHFGTVTAGALGVTATALLDGTPLNPGEERAVDPLWLSAASPGAAYAEYAALWGAEAGARPGRPAPLGWSSSHQYPAVVTPADVRANTALAALHDLALVEIGDGWQASLGDWLTGGPEWPDGPAKSAAEIRGFGLSAGIWTAPFLAGERSALLGEHADWVPLDSRGMPVRAVHEAGSWPSAGRSAFALDTTRPEVLEHLRIVYGALADQGFTHHRVDHCYAAGLPGRRHDPTRTRAQALRDGLQAVRDGLGADAFLIGSGCPFGPAVGLVDAMRVSPPVAPHWLPRRHWAGFEEASPAAVNAVRATVLRAPLHRRLFLNDPDCLLLRPTGTDLEAWQRSFLAAVVTGCGAFAMLSDDLRLYTEAEWTLLDALRAVLSGVDTMLDIDDPFADPVVVRSRAGTKLTVDWHDGAPGGPLAQLGVG